MEESERLEDERKSLRLDAVGKDLLKCAEISRDEGLLAMQNAIPDLSNGSKFLAFAVSYVRKPYLLPSGYRTGGRAYDSIGTETDFCG